MPPEKDGLALCRRTGIEPFNLPIEFDPTIVRLR